MNTRYLVKLGNFNLPLINKVIEKVNNIGDIYISYKGIKLLDRYYGVLYFREPYKFESNLKVEKISLITPFLFCFFNINAVIDKENFKKIYNFLKRQGVIIINDLKRRKV